jgi:hypothetical protein
MRKIVFTATQTHVPNSDCVSEGLRTLLCFKKRDCSRTVPYLSTPNDIVSGSNKDACMYDSPSRKEPQGISLHIGLNGAFTAVHM